LAVSTIWRANGADGLMPRYHSALGLGAGIRLSPIRMPDCRPRSRVAESLTRLARRRFALKGLDQLYSTCGRALAIDPT
jgi:hypothetical protein